MLDDTQKNALHHACKKAKSLRDNSEDRVQADICQRLLGSRSIVDGRDHSGSTALMLACGNGDRAIAMVLLQARADVNAQDTEGNVAVGYAVQFEHQDLVTLL